MKTTLDNYFRQYLDYLQYQRHYADKTIESYKRQIDHFKQFLIEESIDDYNDVVKEAGESNTKDVLRNASWMTGMTDKTSHLLSKIGITIGKGNKLELDEDELKKADISSLKTVFTGYNSFAGKTAQKAAGISNAANRASATYTNNGTYSKTNSSLTSSKIDKEV